MLSGYTKAHFPLPHPLGRASVLRESLLVAKILAETLCGFSFTFWMHEQGAMFQVFSPF
jgi:hypothetical protein